MAGRVIRRRSNRGRSCNGCSCRSSGRDGDLNRGRHRGNLARNTHIQAVVITVITFDLQFGQVVVAQHFGQCLDKGHVCFVSFVFHLILSRFTTDLLGTAGCYFVALIRQGCPQGKHPNQMLTWDVPFCFAIAHDL